jgi:dihydropteroate synthase
LARRLVRYAVRHGVPPKHLEPGLVTLRDPKTHVYGSEYLDELARQIKDHNYRIFAEGDRLHLVSAGRHLVGETPFPLFAELLASGPKNVDASHAFYLGYEMAKAVTALTLGKEYRQDEALDWGYLTVPEQVHRSGRRD